MLSNVYSCPFSISLSAFLIDSFSPGVESSSAVSIRLSYSSSEININVPSFELIRTGRWLFSIFLKSWNRFERALVAVIVFMVVLLCTMLCTYIIWYIHIFSSSY